jgi:hypothetical protein
MAIYRGGSRIWGLRAGLLDILWDPDKSDRKWPPSHSHPSCITTPLPCVVNMGCEKTGLVMLDTSIPNQNSQPSNTYHKLYSQQPLLKHGMVCLLCTTNFTPVVSLHINNPGPSPVFSLTSALQIRFFIIYFCSLFMRTDRNRKFIKRRTSSLRLRVIIDKDAKN